ncbi:MAG: rhodanese-related sulfurtransferase [Planctomycetota bacterium]
MKEITPTDLSVRLAGGESFVLLDVRENQELEIVRLDGIVHIPMGEITSRVGELDPDAPIVCICHHGMRSASVAGFLEQSDFTNITNLTGGMDRWAAEVDSSLARY